MCVEPEESELPNRHATLTAEVLQPLDFLQSLDEPGPRTVRTVVGLIELCVDGVLPFEHARGVRDADEVLRPGIDSPRAERRVEGGGDLAQLLVRLPLHGLDTGGVRGA